MEHEINIKGSSSFAKCLIKRILCLVSECKIIGYFTGSVCFFVLFSGFHPYIADFAPQSPDLTFFHHKLRCSKTHYITL